MTFNLLVKNRHIIIYGAALAVLLFLLKWLELKFLIMNNAQDIYMGTVALFFTVLGIWLALRLTKPKIETIIVEKQIYVDTSAGFNINQTAVDELGLSKRELEVLQLMAQGLSNQEISARLFVSLNTIKTHSSKVFEKMEVKRRTQAVEMGRQLSIIP